MGKNGFVVGLDLVLDFEQRVLAGNFKSNERWCLVHTLSFVLFFRFCIVIKQDKKEKVIVGNNVDVWKGVNYEVFEGMFGFWDWFRECAVLFFIVSGWEGYGGCVWRRRKGISKYWHCQLFFFVCGGHVFWTQKQNWSERGEFVQISTSSGDGEGNNLGNGKDVLWGLLPRRDLPKCVVKRIKKHNFSYNIVNVGGKDFKGGGCVRDCVWGGVPSQVKGVFVYTLAY